jgi:hypothetical protein
MSEANSLVRVLTITRIEMREFYLKAYPTDELGPLIKEGATFIGLLDALHNGINPYEYIGVYDSLVRERLFEELASMLDVSYDYVYELYFKD